MLLREISSQPRYNPWTTIPALSTAQNCGQPTCQYLVAQFTRRRTEQEAAAFVLMEAPPMQAKSGVGSIASNSNQGDEEQNPKTNFPRLTWCGTWISSALSAAYEPARHKTVLPTVRSRTPKQAFWNSSVKVNAYRQTPRSGQLSRRVLSSQARNEFVEVAFTLVQLRPATLERCGGKMIGRHITPPNKLQKVEKPRVSVSYEQSCSVAIVSGTVKLMPLTWDRRRVMVELKSNGVTDDLD
ncbi:hypothetical protein BDU57DRAFT_594422 [Ampelomyces quisqualis]|uniref:Uncharacterized protein n=1 Tax=Ampelomyces quisqualis TaxID=50730 RepID=A0A6A5QTV1_AMPQU|nr:hypothetical protein BDU57DRAFT_594422 [Ampelomyces quisqualis]